MYLNKILSSTVTNSVTHKAPSLELKLCRCTDGQTPCMKPMTSNSVGLEGQLHPKLWYYAFSQVSNFILFFIICKLLC